MNKLNQMYKIFVFLLCLITTAETQIIETRIVPDELKGKNKDYFGSSVAISDEFALVGAMYTNSHRGAAYIYRRDNNNWINEIKLESVDPEDSDRFGTSVAIEGNYACIGAPGDSLWKGSVYLYCLHDSKNWLLDTILTASDGVSWDWFGQSVSLSGDYLLVGADGNESAYVFQRLTDGWVERVILQASDGKDGDQFGWSVSITSDYALIGASDANDGYGSSYLFKRNGDSWEEEVKLTSSRGWAGTLFGDYALVSNYDIDGWGTPLVYVYHRNEHEWIEEARLTPSDIELNSTFGSSLSLFGDYAVIGQYFDNNATGAAYVFRRHEDVWIEEVKLTPLDGTMEEYFGNKVSISNNYIISGNGEYGSRSSYIYTGFKPTLVTHIRIDSTNKKIPLNGDTMIVDINVTNLTNDSHYADLWVSVLSPEGILFNTLGPYDLEFDPLGSYDTQESIQINGEASGGDYQITSYIGTYPTDTLYSYTESFFKYGNGPYILNPIPTQHKWETLPWEQFQSYIVADLDTVFSDLNSDKLSYTVNTDGNTIASLDGSILSLYSVQRFSGISEVIVCAADEDSNFTKFSFNVFIHHLTGIKEVDNNQLSFELFPNYPNPFNPSTTIKYNQAKSGWISIKIYNALGKEVKTLINTQQSQGLKSIVWDGKDNTGFNVSSGLYIYRMISNKYSSSRKMLLLR